MDLLIDFNNQEDKKKLHYVLQNLKKVRYKIKIEKYSPKRSISQNEYYWGCVIKYLCAECGYTKDEMHQELTNQFLSYEKVNPKTGELRKFTKSTTELTTIEFEEYLENVRKLAIEFYDCLIPLPNEIIK